MGHGLQKDLQSLGLSHPPQLTRDTMTYAPFQARGHARKLKALAAELLGSTIQAGRHRAKWVLRRSYLLLARAPWAKKLLQTALLLSVRVPWSRSAA